MSKILNASGPLRTEQTTGILELPAIFPAKAALLLLLSACSTPPYDVSDPNTVRMTIVNTTGNTYKADGKWLSTDGPLSNRPGGLACDNTVNDKRFHSGEYRYWHVAPSDATALLGMRKCAKSANGEPGCSENWHLCGRKVKVRCLDYEFCNLGGGPSLLSRINNNEHPVNNYIPKVFVDELSLLLGQHPKAATSVVLYITDFCPSAHSGNKLRRQCQRPQVDVSTSAFLLMGRTNEEGYIDTNLEVSVELLDADDPTPAGPLYR